MKVLRKRKNFTAGMLVLAVLGALLRRFAPPTVLLPYVLAVGVLAAAVLHGLKPRTDFAPNHRPSVLTLLLLPAALMMAAGAALRAIPPKGIADIVRGCAGTVAAVCVGCFGLLTAGRKKPPLLCCVGLTLALGIVLIVDFRAWSVDPRIGDYMFALFFAICAALLAMNLGSFLLGIGKRRFTLGCCAVGTVCAAITAMDGGFANTLQSLAWVLVFTAEAWNLLTPGRRKRPSAVQPPSPKPEAAPTAPEPAKKKPYVPVIPDPPKPKSDAEDSDLLAFDLTGDLGFLSGNNFSDGLNLDDFRY